MSGTAPVAGVEFQTVQANGLNFRLAVAGDSGPLMLLAHGWPESWYNWRHQMVALSGLMLPQQADDQRRDMMPAE